MKHNPSKILMFIVGLPLCSPLFSEESHAWTPPPPPADEFEWIQLTSGEWLKGEIKSMQDGELEFDSDELDLQTFDWEDIAVIRSNRKTDVVFDRKKSVISGVVSVEDQQIQIQTTKAEAPVILPQDTVIGLAPGGEKESDYWSLKASLGMTYRSGNTDEIDYNARFTANRVSALSRYYFDYLGSYSETEGIETSNSHRIESNYDIWLSQDYFLRIPFFEYKRDPFQNIAHRVTIGVGLGYQIIDTGDTSWSVSAGPAYQYLRYESTAANGDEEQHTPAFYLATEFEQDLTDDLTFIAFYQAQVVSKDAGGSAHHIEGRFEIDLTSKLDLSLSAIYDVTTNPQDGANQNTDSGDFRFVTSLGYEY